MDFAALLECINVVNDVSLGVNLPIALDMQPKEALDCLAAAAHQVLSRELRKHTRGAVVSSERASSLGFWRRG